MPTASCAVSSSAPNRRAWCGSACESCPEAAGSRGSFDTPAGAGLAAERLALDDDRASLRRPYTAAAGLLTGADDDVVERKLLFGLQADSCRDSVGSGFTRWLGRQGTTGSESVPSRSLPPERRGLLVDLDQ
jgi:hypothetical protein